jgi:hypothetical protein
MTVIRFPRPRICLECGDQFQARDDEAHFCTTDCRKTFNNRRAVRGAELYDLYMAHRFERQNAQEAGVFKAINRLASTWREEDRRQRDARRSWRPFRKIFDAKPFLGAVRLAWLRAGR